MTHPFEASQLDPKTLPWLDQPRRQIEDYVATLKTDEAGRQSVYRHLVQWLRHGYTVLPGAVSHALIDALTADIHRMAATFQDHSVPVASFLDEVKHQPIKDYTADEVQRLQDGQGNFRICDFYHYSIAAKKIALHPRIVSMLKHIFRAPPIVLQSLTFWRGTGQRLHQDFAYVPAKIPSQLAASWVALEDIHPDSGPLFYVKGSHFNQHFDWGNGILRTNDSTRDEGDFHEHQLREAEESGEEIQYFCPKKGDVFIWHGALAHGGSPQKDKALTRKSFVTHYSNAKTHDFEYRVLNQPKRPRLIRRELNGGFYHLDPLNPEEEDKFQQGAELTI